MKKFKWRLERVLELKKKQEEMARAELLEMTAMIAAVRNAVIVREIKLRDSLERFTKFDIGARTLNHDWMAKSTGFMNEQISLFRKKLVEYEDIKKQKLAKVMELRKSRKNLEKLKESALEKYREEFKKYEQNDLDDITSISRARELIAGH